MRTKLHDQPAGGFRDGLLLFHGECDVHAGPGGIDRQGDLDDEGGDRRAAGVRCPGLDPPPVLVLARESFEKNPSTAFVQHAEVSSPPVRG